MRSRLVRSLCCLALCGSWLSCAGPRGPLAEQALDDAALAARTRALEALAEEALHPCAERARPEDRGVFAVSARGDGTVALGPFEWLGSPSLLSCLTEGAQRVRLPAWGGPSVSWLWSIGSPRFPAPGLFGAPAEASARLEGLVRDLVTPPAVTVAGPAPGGPITPPGLPGCAAWLQGAPLPRSIFRVFVFPDGSVVGATPVAVASPGPPPMYLECVGDKLRRWTFPPFAGPGFLALDVTLPPGP